jgi:hypothetical protein
MQDPNIYNDGYILIMGPPWWNRHWSCDDNTFQCLHTILGWESVTAMPIKYLDTCGNTHRWSSSYSFSNQARNGLVTTYFVRLTTRTCFQAGRHCFNIVMLDAAGRIRCFRGVTWVGAAHVREQPLSVMHGLRKDVLFASKTFNDLPTNPWMSRLVTKYITCLCVLH